MCKLVYEYKEHYPSAAFIKGSIFSICNNKQGPQSLNSDWRQRSIASCSDLGHAL